MTTFNLALAVFGGVLLLLGLSSGIIKNRLFVSEPIISMIAGILVGPAVFAFLDLAKWGNQTLIVEEIARLTLAIALINIAFQLPNWFLYRNWKTVAVLLGLVMPMMWLVSGILSWWFLDVGLATALLIGAVVTPTDPVLAASIVSGKIAERHLSDDLRFTISAEAGSNDALAYPIVMLMIMLHQHPIGEAFPDWLLHTIGWKIGGALVIGMLVGYGAGYLLKYVRRREDADRATLLTVGIALALAVTGFVKLIGSEGLLAAFVAGLFMNGIIGGGFEEEKQQINEAIKRFFDIPVFLVFGMVLPWHAWADLRWDGPLLVAAILSLRRMPAILLIYPLMKNIRSRTEAVFMGWFGPIGIAALYYAALSLSKKQADIVWEAGSLIIFGSIIIHGITATPLTLCMGRRQA